MNSIIPPEIEEYCEAHTTPERDLLYRLNRATHVRVLRPRMLSGPLQGALLSMLSEMIQPEHILEIGTFTGYATLCLANGLRSGGTLDTIEINEELEDMILQYIGESSRQAQITLHIGDALEIIPALNKSWDLIFLDAEKQDYIKYYQLLLPKLRKGGIMLVDNVLWSGKVIDETEEKDPDTEAIRTFNDYVQADSRVKNLILPLRDGLMMVEKI